MAFELDIFGNTTGGLSDMWNTATGFGGSDGSFTTPRTYDTVPSNALQSMQPIEASNGGGWSDFWPSLAKTAVGYVIQKDAIQSGVVRPGQQYVPAQPGQPQQYARQDPLGGLGPLLLIGGGVLLAVKLLK